MPEGTDNKDVELVDSLALERRSLVDSLSQPLLHTDIPIVDLITYMDAALDHPRRNSIDP